MPRGGLEVVGECVAGTATPTTLAIIRAPPPPLPQVSWRSAYHGLARGIIRVTVDASGSPADRALRAQVNTEAGLAPRSSAILQGPSSAAPTSVVVTASAPGLASATYVIPLSVDVKDAVLAVAAASIGSADIGSLDA